MKQDDARDYSFRRIMPLWEIDFHFAVHAIYSLLRVDFALGNVLQEHHPSQDNGYMSWTHNEIKF